MRPPTYVLDRHGHPTARRFRWSVRPGDRAAQDDDLDLETCLSADVCALPDDVRSAHDAGSRAPSSFTQPRFHQGLLRDLRALGVCSRGPRRSAVFPRRVRSRELHLERRTTLRRSSPLTSRVCSGGLGERKKAPLPDPPASLSRLDSSLGNYPTGIPINRLSSRNRPTTKMPMVPRAIKVLTLPGKCSHRSKSRSHHLSSPSPSRSSTMPPGGIGPQLRIGENARLLQSFGGQCSHPKPAQHGEPASRTSLASAAVPARASEKAREMRVRARGDRGARLRERAT